MDEKEFLEWVHSLPGYTRIVGQLVDLGWPEDAARIACNLTALARTKAGRRVLAATDE